MRQCGFSLIEALDSAAEVVKIPPAALSLHGAQQGSTTLARVVERASRSMWLATVCRCLVLHMPFDLKLNLPRSSRVAALRLWNFNSLDGLTKGVREIEVWQRNLMVWTGEDIPMWLPSQGSSTLERSEWSASHSRLEDGQEELLQSLQALELFRSSQSRRFFPGRRRSESEDSKQALEPAPPAPSPAPMEPGEEADGKAGEGRPPTAGLQVSYVDSPRGQKTPRAGLDGRPMTRATERQRPRGKVCSSLTITVHSTWGDQFYVGLTALEALKMSRTALGPQT
eukprot:g1485.t1